ncbi:MAG: hypothetical protein KAU28_01590, partial [Phycisphaerae bacterium]|nr:hypothetical protein [Phycisphaerae bacterium]
MLAIASVCGSLGLADTDEAKFGKLKAEAEQIAAAQLKRFGEHYEAKLDATRHLIYISTLDDEHFRETAALLAGFADAMRKTLFPTPLPWNVTVVLPTSEDYDPLAPAKNVKGFYNTANRTLTSLDRGRILLHEFTHALHHADAAAAKQKHPVWIREGFATLFESSKFTDEGLKPRVDLRALRLQEAIRKESTIALQRLVKLSPEQFQADALLCY